MSDKETAPISNEFASIPMVVNRVDGSPDSFGIRRFRNERDGVYTAEYWNIEGWTAFCYVFKDKKLADSVCELLRVAVECRAPAPQPAEGVEPWMLMAAQEISNWALTDPPGLLPIARIIARYVLAATPQVTPELELEEEADGRWLAAYTRFPGVAAYGPSKEEAIRNAAKVLIESEQDWEEQDTKRFLDVMAEEGMISSEQASPREFKPYMEDHEYYDPPQASPSPDVCPRCGSDKVWIALPRCHGGTKLRDPWHSSAPKGTK